MNAVLVQALGPTARATSWRPAAAAAGVLVLTALLTGWSDRPGDTVLALAAAGLAAVVVSGLHDPAAALLAPVPVSPMQRRLLRLGLLGVPALLVWWLLTALTTTVGSSGPAPLVALTACGVAVTVWAPPKRAVLVGASTPVVLFALQALPTSGLVSDALAWWRTDPWWVLCAAVVACVAGRQR